MEGFQAHLIMGGLQQGAEGCGNRFFIWPHETREKYVAKQAKRTLAPLYVVWPERNRVL